MRYTAANTALLTVIKRHFNSKIYKHALNIYNTETKEAVYTYLQQFSTKDLRPWLIEETNAVLESQSYERARCFKHLIR